MIIATDDKRIQAAAGKFGAHAVLTSTRHRSGTDRIAEAANACGLKDDEIIVNVQGDEYGLPARLINQVATALHNNSGKAIATLSEPLVDETRIIDSNVVKVVVDHDNNALYFSRSIIPWMKHAVDGRIYRRHVGLYAYTARTLQAFTQLAASALEKSESLEQLRALHHGWKIHVEMATANTGIDINTQADLDRIKSSDTG